MSTKALSDYVVYSKYAKYLPHKERRETWKEQVDRVFDMHEHRYSMELKSDAKLQEMFDEARQAVYAKEVLGSQRALQFGGDSIRKHNEKMYNCATTYIDRVEAFSQTLFCLLAGNGVGFSVQKHHIAKLPEIQMAGQAFGGKTSRVVTIGDSIEGWADSVDALLRSYFVGGNNQIVEFNYSAIRPEGSPISGGFKAPGHKGLQKAHENIRAIMDRACGRIENPGTNKSPKVYLKPIEVYDILMHCADAVLSGGVRRAATICIFSHDDDEMLNAKTGDWLYENPQRARSNNSALLVRGEVTFEEFFKVMKSVRHYGEPGFVWADSKEHMFNPCVTGDTMLRVKDHDLTENGKVVAKGVEYEMSIKDYVESYSDPETSPLVLSQNVETGENVYAHVTGAQLTRRMAEIVEIELDDGKVIKCTPDHKIYTSNRGYVEAKDLTEDDDITVLD